MGQDDIHMTACEDFESTKLIEAVSLWCDRNVQTVRYGQDLYQDFRETEISKLNWALRKLANDRQIY